MARTEIVDTVTGLQRQLARMRAENDRLRAENEALRSAGAYVEPIAQTVRASASGPRMAPTSARTEILPGPYRQTNAAHTAINARPGGGQTTSTDERPTHRPTEQRPTNTENEEQPQTVGIARKGDDDRWKLLELER